MLGGTTFSISELWLHFDKWPVEGCRDFKLSSNNCWFKWEMFLCRKYTPTFSIARSGTFKGITIRRNFFVQLVLQALTFYNKSLSWSTTNLKCLTQHLLGEKYYKSSTTFIEFSQSFKIYFSKPTASVAKFYTILYFLTSMQIGQYSVIQHSSSVHTCI